MERKCGSLCQRAIRKSLQRTVQESSSNKYIPELFGSQTGNHSRKLWLVPVCALSRFPMTPPFCFSLLSSGFFPFPSFFSSSSSCPPPPFSVTSNSLIAQRSKAQFTVIRLGSLLPSDLLAVIGALSVLAYICFCVDVNSLVIARVSVRKVK